MRFVLVVFTPLDVDKIVSANQTYYKVELEYGEHETTVYVDSKGKQLDNVPLY